jgi:hypothetical protein
MSKVTPNSFPFAEAQSTLAMLDIVSDPEHYKACFNIKDKDIEDMRQLLDKKERTVQPKFYEK